MARRLQWLVLLAAGLIWTVRPEPYFWALLAAYGIAWLLAHWIDPSLLERRVARPLLWGGLALLLLAPMATAYRQRAAWLKEEGLRGFRPQLEDRVRLQNEPAIFPPLLSHDRPQTFYGYAPGAGELALRLGTEGTAQAGTALGGGLFRFEVNPRDAGGDLTERRRLPVELIADGRAHRRELLQVHPFAHPRWFASAPEAGLAATASEETDELFLVSRTGLERAILVGDGPTDVAFVRSDRALAVSHRYDPNLWVVPVDQEAATEKLDLGPFQHRLATAPEGGLIAVAVGGSRPRIEIVTTEPLELADSIPLESIPDWIAFGRSADELLVSSRETRTLHRLRRDESGSWTASPPLELGRPAVFLTRSPDGATAYAAVTDYRPDGKPRSANHFIQDQILVVDVATWSVVDRVITSRRSSRQRRPGNVDSGAGPVAATAREDGSLLVAFAGSEEVWMLPPGAHHPAWIRRGHDLDLATPYGVGDLGDGYWAASSPAGGAMAVYSESGGEDGRGEMVEFIGVAPTDDELLAAPEGSTNRFAHTLRAGERGFFEATRSGVSCASCHIHADTDHSEHNIGQRELLPTLTVRGVTGTSPYLRDGSFPRVRDLDTHLARTLYRGYRRRLAGRGEAVEAFVESLPRQINPASLGERDVERERAGMAAFERASCDLCHRLPAFTHLGRHPVRALFPDYGERQYKSSVVDTASLLGTHARSHFLQDGRAHDLEEVLLDHNESNRHGDVKALSEDERAALIYFLESL